MATAVTSAGVARAQDDIPSPDATRDPGSATEAAPIAPAEPDPEGAPAPSPEREPGPATVAADGIQQPNDVPLDTEQKSRFLEEIVVTAQKREENLQDVPISINAFSADALEVRGINNPTDLKLVTPSLVYDELVGYAVIYIRGVGADLLTPTAEPSVATYIDGVYLPLNHGLAKDFTPVERVEVLKGPQGTLFGRNATGGAINIITVKPDEDWRIRTEAGIGSFSEKRAKAYLAGPLFDGLTFSIAGLYSDQDPYYDLAESSPQDKLEDNTSKGVSPRLHWELSDQLSLSLAGYFTRFLGTGTVINSQLDPTPLGELVGSQQTGPHETAFNEPGTLRSRTDVGSATVDYQPGPIDIKLIGSYQDNRTDTRWDYDNGPTPAVYFYPTNQYLLATTGELQLLSNDDTAFADYLEWVAGAYYYKAAAGINPIFAGAFNFDSSNPIPDAFNNLLTGIRDLAAQNNIPLPGSIANLVLRGGLEIDSWAGFAQGTIKATDWLNVTLGARYQTEDRELVKSTVGVVTDGFDDHNSIEIFDFLANEEYKSKKDDISPRVAIDIKPFDNFMLYTSYSQAFKSATFNLVNLYTPPNAVRPEKTTAYEFGLKGSFGDGALRYNAAVFRNDVKDIQTMILQVPSGGLINIVNAAEGRIKGAEADITWQMFPRALPGLVATGSVGYLRGRYLSFPEGAGFDETTGLAFGPNAPLEARDFAGNKTVRTPKWSGAFGLGYTFTVPFGDLEIASDIYYNDGYYFDPQNTTEQPQYTLVSARMSYFIEPWNLRITANGQNLTDEIYFVNIFPNDFGKAGTGAPPRNYSVTVKWDF